MIVFLQGYFAEIRSQAVIAAKAKGDGVIRSAIGIISKICGNIKGKGFIKQV